jgi:hypothetical protein
MESRIDDCIEIRTESLRIDPGSISGCIRDHGAGHKAMSLDRSQLSDGRAVSGHNDRSAGLHLTEHRARIIAELPLRNGATFHV